jgi:protein-S-isoprenylcysteine O-methyltransferase Ste14
VSDSAASLPSAPPLATIRRRIFSWRMQVGLAAVFLAAFVVKPRNVFGKWQLAGDAACILLVLAGLSLRAWAGGNAGQHTRRATIEAPRLVTGGPFAYVRNPIYLASIILGLGMVGLLGDPWMLALYVGVFVFLYTAIVPAEEQFLTGQFPEEYARYRSNVPRLLPRLTRWSGAVAGEFDRRALVSEALLGLTLIGIYLFLQAAAWLRGA